MLFDHHSMDRGAALVILLKLCLMLSCDASSRAEY